MDVYLMYKYVKICVKNSNLVFLCLKNPDRRSCMKEFMTHGYFGTCVLYKLFRHFSCLGIYFNIMYGHRPVFNSGVLSVLCGGYVWTFRLMTVSWDLWWECCPVIVVASDPTATPVNAGIVSHKGVDVRALYIHITLHTVSIQVSILSSERSST